MRHDEQKPVEKNDTILFSMADNLNKYILVYYDSIPKL